MASDLSRRIEYIFQSMDLDDAAEKIAGMLEAKDQYIKKLAEICSAQEKELENLKKEKNHGMDRS